VLAGRRVGLRVWAAALAGLVFAWSPLLVRLGRYATPDALMTALVAFGVWATAGVARHGRWRDYLLAGLAVGLAAGAKYNAALIFVMILVAHLLSRPKELGAWGRLLAAGGVSLVSFAAILAWPWADFDTFLNGLRYEWRHYGKGHDGFGCANAAQEALAYLFGFALGPLAAAALGLGLIAAFLRRRERRGQSADASPTPTSARAQRDLGYAALAFVLVYLLLLTRQNLFFARLVAPLIPALAVLIALAASTLVELVVDRFGPRWRPLAVTSTLGSILLLPAVATGRQLQAIRAPDTRGLAYEWIDANLRDPEVRLVVIPRSAQRLVPEGIESTTVYSGMSVRRMGEIGATHVVFNAGSIERFRWRPEQHREALATWEALHEQLETRARLVRRWQHAPLPGARHFGDSGRTIHHSTVELWALGEP
jgi:4-amino-4-deoxy-L-arabinose transferase-like glycosyltransferase